MIGIWNSAVVETTEGLEEVMDWEKEKAIMRDSFVFYSAL